ncbi:hypothetical protein M0804_008999 [Polistes exclamans]|nr:hypothetical protein M0804_008999 [Polistes exclamans]
MVSAHQNKKKNSYKHVSYLTLFRSLANWSFDELNAPTFAKVKTQRTEQTIRLPRFIHLFRNCLFRNYLVRIGRNAVVLRRA